MFYFVLRVFLALFFGFGKVFSSAGINLFGSRQILEYFPQHPAQLKIPLNTLAFVSNAHTNFFAKFFNIWDYFTREEQQAMYTRLYHLSCNQKAAVFLLIAIGYAYGVLASLPSYLIGTTIYDFFAGKDTEENPEDIPILARVLSLYIILSYIFSNYSFNLKNIKSNTKKSVEALGNLYHDPKKIFNRYLLFTVILSVAGLRAYTSYTYFSTYQSLLNIPLIHKTFKWMNNVDAIDPFAKTIAILAAVLSVPSNVLSLVAKVYLLFNQQSMPKSIKERGFDNKYLYCWTFLLGFIDTLIQGSGSFVSVVRTSQDWFGADPYARSTVIDAIICALSAAFLYFCFTVQEATSYFKPQMSNESRQINIETPKSSYGTFFRQKAEIPPENSMVRRIICCMK